MGPMEIRNFTTLVNKCRLVEECNRKLKLAKFDAHKKSMAPDTQDSEDTLPSKKQFQSDWYEGEKSQRLIIRQKCSEYGRDHGNNRCLVGQKVCFKCEECPHKY